MTRTLQDLYTERCVVATDGSLVPHFWQPQPMQRAVYCKLGDERSTLRTDELAAVDSMMQRLIALGLQLELDVGSFVQKQTRGEYPQEPLVQQLLRSAVADEARHELGFKYAAAAYGFDSGNEAERLKQLWVRLADKYQPIAVAAVLEQQVFLVTLGLMRMLGGKSLSELAMRIAEDESRHVATNVAISSWLGVQLGSDVGDAVAETLSYAVGDAQVAVTPAATVNFDFCWQASQQLASTGCARQLDRLTRIAQHRMPFEVSNQSLYATRATEAGATVY